MKFVLLPIAFICIAFAIQASHAQSATQTVNVLRMSIAPDPATSSDHPATQFTITFTNASQRTLSFAPGTTIHCGIRPSKTTWVKLNLTDPKGKLHRRMDYLGDGPPYVGTCAGRVEVFIVTLRPHESISLPLDLGKYVDLTDAKQFEMTRFPAGTYSLEAEFTSVWESPLQDKKTTWLGTVKSNTIQIQFASEFAAAYVEP
jgi:hypothetical protein